MTTGIADLARLYEARGSGAVPAYQRVKDLVSEQITSGRWREGDALPSESQFVASLGLSRMTVNRALRELAAEGLIRRVMGVGSFVALAKGSSCLVEVHNIAEEVRRRGHRYEARVLALGEEPAGARTAAEIGVAEGRPVFHSRLLHSEDGTVIQIEDRYVNPGFAPGYLAQDFTARTPFSFLSEVAPLDRGEHIVEAVLPSPEEAALLGVAGSEPCLLIHRRTWSRGAPVSVARLLHPGSRYRLEGAFEAGRPAG
ncbi:histidine utilization repressor [Streptomyces sp. RS10V-4]|uniref:histidine utilization repressor n=1 Tax=Streptomyces rhizoryzae TaxID=2932493 RepID=UPI0020034599|nr:histidine utilization repressor [Streptomyces rhizoryzae]MCK7622817.1 histidine utilization repressor [Streptomyces rhizoryzae]